MGLALKPTTTMDCIMNFNKIRAPFLIFSEYENRVILGGYHMQNLKQLTERVKQEYSNLHSYDVLSENISLTEAG